MKSFLFAALVIFLPGLVLFSHAQEVDTSLINPIFRASGEAYQEGDIGGCIHLMDSLIQVCEDQGYYYEYATFSNARKITSSFCA